MTDSSALFDDASGPDPRDISDWTDLGREMWSYLTNRGAVVNYSFVDMTVEVPRDIGPDAPRATWKLNGTLRITTSDDEMPVAVHPSSPAGVTASAEPSA